MATADAAPTTGRHRRRERFMQEVQAAAFELFEQQGYDATTVDEVAAAADVSPRTMFRHFESKEDLVFWSTYSPRLPSLVAEQPADVSAVLALRRAIAAGLSATFGEDEDRILRWARLGFRTPSLLPRMRATQANVGDLFTQLLLERTQAQVPDLKVRVVGAAMGAALFVALDRWQQGDGRGDLRALIDTALGEVCGVFDF